MKTAQSTRLTFIKVLTCSALALGWALPSLAADANGTWTWSTPGRDGGEARKSTLKLKVDAGKVTGTVSTPGRDGQARDVEITNGKISGDDISFDVVREFNGNKVTAKYAGKLSGDTITGKVEVDREGNARSRDWVAKREGK